MERKLLALPAELQVSIFSILPDLDDARSLSNTCRVFRSLYTAYQKPIKRATITRSPVYEYDPCLSNLLHAWEDAAKVLREYEGDVPDKLRLSGSVCLDCFDDADMPLTDVDVDEISKRWWKLGILRGLYLDEAISRNFEKHKVEFVSNGLEYLGPDGIGPIIEESLEVATQTTHNLEDAPDFKARFHQGLCLHSIAFATRSHAMYSRDQVQMETDPPNLIGTKLIDTAYDLWEKAPHCFEWHCCPTQPL